MKKLFRSGLLALALVAGTVQSWALEGAVVIANEGVPASSLTPAALKDIYNGKTTYWEGGQNITIAFTEKTDADIS